MSTLNREDFMNAVNTLLGDRTDEDTLNLVGDITDTYNSLEETSKNNEDMIPRSELDRTNKEWAEKYKQRFFSTPVVEKETDEDKDIEKGKGNKKLTYENLFKTEWFIWQEELQCQR